MLLNKFQAPSVVITLNSVFLFIIHWRETPQYNKISIKRWYYTCDNLWLDDIDMFVVKTLPEPKCCQCSKHLFLRSSPLFPSQCLMITAWVPFQKMLSLQNLLIDLIKLFCEHIFSPQYTDITSLSPCTIKCWCVSTMCQHSASAYSWSLRNDPVSSAKKGMQPLPVIISEQSNEMSQPRIHRCLMTWEGQHTGI